MPSAYLWLPTDFSHTACVSILSVYTVNPRRRDIKLPRSSTGTNIWGRRFVYMLDVNTVWWWYARPKLVIWAAYYWKNNVDVSTQYMMLINIHSIPAIYLQTQLNLVIKQFDTIQYEYKKTKTMPEHRSHDVDLTNCRHRRAKCVYFR